MNENKDLRELIRLIYGGRRIIGWTMVAMTVLSTGLAILTQNVYPATTTLMPASSGNANGILNSLMDQVGGLASLVGLSPKQNDPTSEAIAILQSRRFIENFIRTRNILSKVTDQGWGNRLRIWLNLGTKPPKMWNGYEYFRHEVLIVDRDKKTSIVTVEVDWINRREAADWANDLVRRLNETMRQRAIAEADKSINYLKVQLGKTSMVPLRDAIFKLIDADIKERMIAEIRDDYAFRVIDPAAVPSKQEKVKPHRVVYVIGGLISGFFLGVLFVLARDFARQCAEWYRQS